MGLIFRRGVPRILKPASRNRFHFPLVEGVAQDDADEIGLCAIPGFDIVVEAPVEVFLVRDGEVDLGGGAAAEQQEGDQVS